MTGQDYGELRFARYNVASERKGTETMKPFARINLSSVALRRGIIVSSLALAAAGCISIERTGEYYVAHEDDDFREDA